MGIENSGDIENLVQAGTVHQINIHNHEQEGLRAEQLPPETAGFVDREDEQARLHQAWSAVREPGKALCVLISGGSGTGKSALAIRWVHAVSEGFERVYLDLRGRPVELEEVLWHCLHAFGAEYPGSVDAALGTYRSKTKGRRVALVFDNVVQPRKLLPLLPESPDGLLVMISQRHMRDLVVDGVLPLELRRLGAEAGVELLRAAGAGRVQAEPEQAARIVELCGGLPIALRIIARRLAKRPGWALARIVRELEDDQRRLDRFTEDGVPVVREALDRAIGELPPQQRVLYLLLGNIPGPTFSAAAVAALAGLPEDEVDDSLHELHEADLLEIDDNRDFRFHDLVRLHAVQRRADDPAALRRLADWYRVCGAYADRAIMEPERFRVGQDDELLHGDNPFDRASALAWLERERVNLLAVLHAAHAAEWDRIVISLCDSPVWTLHNQHKHYRDTIGALEAGVRSAERAADAVAEARMRTLLVRLHAERQDFAAAGEQAGRAVEVAERSGHRRALASALEFRGDLHLREQEWSAAIPLFERSRELNEELGLPRAVALQEYKLGRALVGGGRPEEGLRWLERAARRLQDFPRDTRTPDRIRVAMGRAHRQLGDHAEALRRLREAEAGFRGRQASHDLAEPLELLAELHEHTGDTAAARECAAEAVAVLEDSGDPRAGEVRARFGPLLG